MLHLDAYPLACQQAVENFSRAVPAWAAASGLTADDVRQELSLAALMGADPARAVPKALGIRRLQGGRWVALDPISHRFVDVEELGEKLTAEGDTEEGVEEFDIGGTVEIAARLGVTRRRAQQIVAAQRRRVDRNGDLFRGVE